MLPKIDVHGGRGPQRRDHGHRDGEPSAVVPLPRLRLLKQVGGEEQPVPSIAPHAPQRKPPSAAAGGGGLHAVAHEGSVEARPGSNQQPQRRGRGLLRPLDPSGEARLPGRSRSPPVQPRALHSPAAGEDDDEDPEGETTALILQQRARERVKEERRQRRRAAKEEAERKLAEEQERIDRAQKNAGQVEAHRKELARNAAERSRRLREDREAAMHEREELQSARRERIGRYMTPDKIREWRHKDGPDPTDERGSSNEVVADKPPVTCTECGNAFMPDAIFCRKCGAKRAGSKRVRAVNGSGRPSPEPGAGPRRAARAPSADPPSRRARRRRSEGDSAAQHRRGHGVRQHSNELSQQRSRGRGYKGPACEGAELSPDEVAAPPDAAALAGRCAVQAQEVASTGTTDYYRQHVLQAMSPSTWAALYTPFMVQHAAQLNHRTPPVLATAKSPTSQAPKDISVERPSQPSEHVNARERLQVALAAAWASGSLATAISVVSSPA